MIYGERVRQARELYGLTQEELATKVGVNQSAIARIENDNLTPSKELIEAIGRQTGFLASFFEQEPIENFSEGSLAFRSRCLSSHEESRVYQYAKIMFEHAKRMSQKLKLSPHRLPQTEDAEPQVAARIVRTSLGLSPDTPLKSLMRVVESNGIIIFMLPLMSPKIDAFSTWAEMDYLRPIIAISLSSSMDRARFSISHEIGHLVLHRTIKGRIKSAEDAANLFASEFLLPEVAMRRELLPPVSLTSIAKLKARWGVSMQALLYRARGLGIITERQFRYLFQQMAARGWKKREPSNLDVPVEKPQALRRMAETLYDDIEQYANDMHLRLDTAMEMFLFS